MAICPRKDTPMIDRMKALIKAKDTCVLATVSEGTPHCSLMAYATDDDCREIYMVSHGQTTKFRNMTENPSVSLLIDTREEHTGARRPEAKAMTVDGFYEKTEDETKKNLVRSRLLERHPHLKSFMAHPEAEILCIKMRSFLLLDGIKEAYFEKLQGS